MTSITFDSAAWRASFPAFANETMFTDAMVMDCFTRATCYLPNQTTSCINAQCLQQALYLMTAHLCQLSSDMATGKDIGILTSASVGSVSVGLQAPPVGSDQWSWWLNTTPYGAQYLALLDSLSVGGFYIGGSCERAAFRGVGGVF